jgi:TonB-linked SusC/RagA family outer membrane protein
MRRSALLVKVVIPLLFIFSFAAQAQSQTVTGTVKDSDKKTPLAGVTIKVVGTTTLTQTNEKGVFTIKASKGQTLAVSYVGYDANTVTVNGNSLDISLKAKAAELDDVVVVAMDLKRNSKELGYSAQTAKGKDIQETQRENFVNSLQGRIAGATVTATSGVPGASSSIVLRGFNSMSLSNQPLFVVDGIIIDNSTVDATANVAAAAGQNNTSNDFTNRIADINPNDIESITVLKGPEATVLYGSSASNGAIVITTRKAKLSKGKTFNVFYDNSFRFQKLQRMPSTFNGYQNGLNGVASATFSAFGPAYTPGTVFYDNVGNFFQTAGGQTHNIGIDFGTAKSNYRITGSYYNQSGVVPNTSVTKYNFKITNTIRIGTNLEITPSVAFIKSNNDKAMKGAGGYLLNLFLWPTTDNAQNYLLANGHKRYLYLANNDAADAGLSVGTAETDNPFFAVNKNVSRDDQNRYIGTLAVNYSPLKWLQIAGRFGYDKYDITSFQYRDPESASQSSMSNKGSLDNLWSNYTGYNHTISATARKSFGDFNARLTIGTRYNFTETDRYGVSGTQDSIRSFDSSSTAPSTRTRLSRATLYGGGYWNLYKSVQVAEFAEMTLNYKSFVYLTGSIAFESSSVLPKANRNYNYPGASLSFIMTDAFPKLKTNVLSYWKMRTSLASTARLPDPYSNQSNFVPTVTSVNMPSTSLNGNLINVPLQYAFTNANPYLKPEKQRTFEVGTEFRLFHDIISVDADYYNTKADGQIAQGFRASYGTGFVLNTANNSSVKNEGIEITLGVKAVQTKNFDWNIQFNFNHMWSEVLAIPAPIDIAGADYYDASTWLYGNARGGLQKGKSTGTITSFGYRRQDLTPTGANGLTANDGAILISTTTGLPVQDATFRVHGDRSPWISLGTVNRLRYKNWNLSFLWDLRMGGDVFNATNMYLTTLGKSTKTQDRLTPRVIQGVLSDGLQNSATPTKNNIMVTPYYNYLYYSAGNMPEEDYIEHNINSFRLRDISLSYGISPAYLQRHISAIKSLSLFVTCNDLVMFTNYSGADPSANGGNASLRGVGAVGFDYGNIAAPLSFNAGFKLGL